MNKRQERRLNMYEVTLQRLEEQTDATLLARMPRIEEYRANLSTTLSKIREATAQQVRQLGGSAIAKRELRAAAAANGLGVAMSLKAYAINHENSALADEMDYTESKMKRYPDNVLVGHLDTILAGAQLLVADLKSYGVDTARLDMLATQTNDFRNALPNPRQGIVTTKDATRRLAQLFDEADVLVTKMDALVAMISDAEPQFAGLYNDSRIIVDTGSRPIPVRGTVTDADGVPLPKVRVTVKGMRLKRMTTDLGNFQIRELAGGVYDLALFKPGYTEQTVQINVTEGVRTDVAVVMG